MNKRPSPLLAWVRYIVSINMPYFVITKMCSGISVKKQTKRLISWRKWVFCVCWITLTCFSTICLVRLLSCQIGFRWASFVKASITSHLLFLTYPSLDALTPFTSMIGKTVFHCLPSLFFIYNSHLLCLSEYQMCSCKPRCSQYMIPDN